MPGAPAIAATAALRSGVGLCKVMTDEDVLLSVLTIQPSATGAVLAAEGAIADKLDEMDAQKTAVLAVGPGFGQAERRKVLVPELLASGRCVLGVCTCV